MALIGTLAANGTHGTHALTSAPNFSRPTAPRRSRTAYAAAHVVRE